MAAEQGVPVDEEGFRGLIKQQRDHAKADAKAKKSGHGDTSVYRRVADTLGREVEFTGYDQVVTDSRLAGCSATGEVLERFGPGDEVELVLDHTPFYAESGGQLADQGRIRLTGGAVIEVPDVQQPIPGLVVHRARCTSARGQWVSAEAESTSAAVAPSPAPTGRPT